KAIRIFAVAGSCAGSRGRNARQTTPAQMTRDFMQVLLGSARSRAGSRLPKTGNGVVDVFVRPEPDLLAARVPDQEQATKFQRVPRTTQKATTADQRNSRRW